MFSLSLSHVTPSLSTPSIHSSLSPSSIRSPQNDVALYQEKGLRHAIITLEPRQYRTPYFILQLLDCLRLLRVPFWSTADIKPSNVEVSKVSGALTNAIFFVSYPAVRESRKLLLRVYGSSSGCLISRPRELHTLHILSSQYHIGPRVYGTFENGRVEEYFQSTPLTPSDIRNPTISRWIGIRMAELHLVDIERVEGKPWEIGVQKNVRSWLPPAEQVLALSNITETTRRQLDIESFKKEWIKYLHWLSTVDDAHNGSRRVFAHNDTQYGNLLMLQQPSKDLVDEHRQLVVVDFEYACPNPASFDIANHFHEWTANYHSPSTPYLLDPSYYPSSEERRNFYTAYLGYTNLAGEHPLQDADRELQIANLDNQVRIWSPASHAMWAIWGIVQSREDVEGNVDSPEFDYVRYSIGRMTAFRQEIQSLGV